MLDVFSNKVLLSVPFVAKMAIFLVLEYNAAGFIAGYMPIKGIS
jgi:hypothetical protein